MFGPPTPILRSFDERRAKRFYVDFLGMQEVPRPAFDFPGTWFQSGGV